MHDYWKDNQTVFKLDSVSFLYIWGSMLTWITITVLCLIIGALSYSKLDVYKRQTEINAMPVPDLEDIQEMGRKVLKSRDYSEANCNLILEGYCG